MIDYKELKNKVSADVSDAEDKKIILDLIEKRIPRELLIKEVLIDGAVRFYEVVCPSCGEVAFHLDFVCQNKSCTQVFGSRNRNYWDEAKRLTKELGKRSEGR